MKDYSTDLKKIQRKLLRIEQLIKRENPKELNDFVSEFDAKKILSRGTTWFWNLRKNGLPYTKVGAQVYYKKNDLYAYIDSNMQGVNNE